MMIKKTESVNVDWTKMFKYDELIKEEIEAYDNIEVTDNLTEGGVHAFDLWSSWFDFLYNTEWKTSLRAEVISFANRIESPQILSLGCGYGGHEISIAHELRKPYQIIATDLNDHLFTEAKRIIEKDSLNITFLDLDLNFFEVEEESFDIVFAIASLHHIVNLENLFFQVYRGLKKQGRFIVQDIIGQTQVLFWKQNVDFARSILNRIFVKYNILNQNIDAIIPAYIAPDIQVGMEGIRQGEIENKIRDFFDPILIYKYGSFMRLICTNPFLQNLFRFPNQEDKAFIEYLFRLDLDQINQNLLKPTELFAVFTKKENVDGDQIMSSGKFNLMEKFKS